MRTKKEIKKEWLQYQKARQELLDDLLRIKCCNPDEDVKAQIRFLHQEIYHLSEKCNLLAWVLGETF